MSLTLNQRIKELENNVDVLESAIAKLLGKGEGNAPKPYSINGQVQSRASFSPISPQTGLGDIYGGELIWNNLQLQNFPIGSKPPGEVTEGYNRHSHSRYSGGALDINTLEVVEYDVVWATDTDYHKDCQDYWDHNPPIAKEQKTNGENVDKLGTIDFVFNADRAKWGVASYEIDVKKCYLVLRDSSGNIETDSKGNEMKAPLYNASDPTKSCVIWDPIAACWRFFAVYAD